MPKETVDVFAFLVEDDDQNKSKPDVPDPGYTDKNVPVRDDSDTESIVRSMHSDSGISMGDSITNFGNDSLVDTHLPPLLEDVQEHQENHSLRSNEPSHSQRTRWKWPDIPAATHKHHLPPYTARTSSPEQVRIRIPYTPE